MARRATSSRDKKSRKPASGTAKSQRRRGPIGQLFYWTAVVAIWGVMIFTGLSAWVAYTGVRPDQVALPQRSQGLTVLAADGELLSHRGTFLGDDVRLDELPDYLPQAVIATEDRRFYYHFGVDPVGLSRAMLANFKAGRIVQGGSTLTQQLAKNLFLKPERTLHRKAQEAVLALWLELQYSKEEILQLYLNRVYFGAGAYGVNAAAQRYFGKSAREITLAEAAVLAGLLKAPTRYAPTRNAKLSRARARLVLANMVEAGFITPDDAQYAGNRKMTIAGAARLPAVNYVVDWVAELVPLYTGAQDTDLIVETTIDPHLQKLADAAVSGRMDAEGEAARAGQAAAVVIDANGAIKAMVGGRSYSRSQFNRATQARRQPGSAFKPFVYLAALERGMRPSTVRVDQPVRIGNWRPENYNERYAGPMPLTQALARSSNVIAATLTREVGVPAVISTARRMGISSPLAENASLALGTSEVTLLELTAAYTPFANGGYGVIPFIIHRITTRDGDVLYRRSGSGPGVVIDPGTLADLNTMMSAVVEGGTGRAAALDSHPAAGKTGTSQDFRDAWFVGYTASLVTGVWVGNDNGAPTRKVTGGGLPARIWRDIMQPAHARLPVEPLPGGGWAPRRGGDGNAIERLLSSLSLGGGPAREPGYQGPGILESIFEGLAGRGGGGGGGREQSRGGRAADDY